MGLDSVELVVEIEHYFQINIPNKEAERLTTIQEMVDCVAIHKNITLNSEALKEHVFAKIEYGLKSLDLLTDPLLYTNKISNFLQPTNYEIFEKLEHEIELEIQKPELKKESQPKFIATFFNAISMAPMYNWTEITVDEFVNAVCIYNFENLINKNNITSLYEIYIAVSGITMHKTGVDSYELLPEKSFTSDLGID